MSIHSPEVRADLYEVHLYAHPDLTMDCPECGMFRSEEEAVRVGALVRLWFQLDLFGAELKAAVPDADDQLSLFALPEVVAGLGYDPRRVLVTVGTARAGLRSAGAVPDEVWREDGGHGAPRGPRAAQLAGRE